MKKQILPPINVGTPTNEVLYEHFVDNIQKEYTGYLNKFNKNVFGFAAYVYEQIKYGMDKFGKDKNLMLRDVEKQLSLVNVGLHTGTLKNYYLLMQFMEDVKISDRILYDRLLDQVSENRISMSPLGYLARNKKLDLEKKKQIILDNLDKHVTGETILAQMNYGVEKMITNHFYGKNVAVLAQGKYLSGNVFCPFPPQGVIPTTFHVPPREINKTFYLDGIFSNDDGTTIEDSSYDGVFLFIPQFSSTDRGEVAVNTKEDLINRIEAFVKESFRITKLDGTVVVLGWDKKLFGEVVNYPQIIYQEMDKYGDWFNTAMWPVSKSTGVRFYPSCAFRTLHIFKKR